MTLVIYFSFRSLYFLLYSSVARALRTIKKMFMAVYQKIRDMMWKKKEVEPELVLEMP